VARTRVIAKPGPSGEHVVERRIGQRLHVRPEREKFAVVACDRLHRRLLQHDFAQPDAVGIGALAPGRPPRQHARMLVVPGQQACGRTFALLRCLRHNRTMAQSRKDKQPDDAPPPRRGWVGALGPDVEVAAQTALSRAGFSDPTLVLRWEEIAGSETARLAQPIKISESASGGVLTLRAEPGAALFLQHDSRALCERINAYLGRPAVSRLRFVQGPLTPRERQPL